MRQGLAGDEPRGGPPHSGGEVDTMLYLIQETFYNAGLSTLGYLITLVHSSLFQKHSGLQVICLTLLG